jgi:hypothetical protein
MLCLVYLEIFIQKYKNLWPIANDVCIVHITIYVILFCFIQDAYYNILGRNFVDAQDTR